MRGLIGVVHVRPLPGDPGNRGESFADVMRLALADARTLARGGADGIVIENFGSAPFAKGRMPPHQAAALTMIADRCRQEIELPIGVNCLRNDAMSALGIAAALDLAFVRVNVHVGVYVTDQGVIEGAADRTMRYRQALGGKAAVLADVHVKHGAPLAPRGLADAVGDTLFRGLADGVIVSGPATGRPVDIEDLRQARSAAGEHLVLIGSGLTPNSIEDVLELADGAIVGTWLKHDGRIDAPIDERRVRELVERTRSWVAR